MISVAFTYQKRRRSVLGREMAYVEVGQDDPIVPMHGNPASSYLWRNVLPHQPDEIGQPIASWMATLADRAPGTAAMSGATE